ncbi:MAG: DUF3552 domain-containing protein, partial [Kiritimatiellaceae bacterium]|nr:DUF3552 domain-containing protein [Kiritimatiellaceae bacterium]
MEWLETWWGGMQDFVLSIGFVILGFFFHAYLTRVNAVAASHRGSAILKDAEKQADAIKHEAEVTAREELISMREKADQSLNQKRDSIVALEDRVLVREKDISRKLELLEAKDRLLTEKMNQVDQQNETLKADHQELKNQIEQATLRVQEAAGLSKDAARQHIIEQTQMELESEISGLIRQQQKRIYEQARMEARSVVCAAIERYAGDHVSNITVTQVALPSEDMKGRLIGKEGRNFKSFETESGVNLIIDETPGMVQLSSFDPVRREVARVALEKLLADGRIHPASIEETIKKTQLEIDEIIRQAGEDALYKLGISGVAPEIVKVLGRLKYRTSYKQNVLDHSVEMAFLMAMMAADLDLDANIAKRVGLFHDLGKALDHDLEGSHAMIGANLLRKYGEMPIVYNAVASHHEEIE